MSFMMGHISSWAFSLSCSGRCLEGPEAQSSQETGEALTPGILSVLSRYSHFALRKDGLLCQSIWHSAQCTGQKGAA